MFLFGSEFSKQPLKATSNEGQARRWLIFASNDVLSADFVAALKTRHSSVTVAKIGRSFKQVSELAFELAPDQPRQFEELLSSLGKEGAPDFVVYFWSATQASLRSTSMEDAVDLGFFGLMYLLQALGKGDHDAHVCLTAITMDAQSVTGEEEQINPFGSVARGPCQVGNAEYDNISCRMIDITRRDLTPVRRLELVERLLEGISGVIPSSVAAYRCGQLWIPMLDRMDLEPCPLDEKPLRTNGVYLITGGLGGLGLAVAKSIAERKPAKLILTSRSSFPARDKWHQHLAASDTSKEASVIRQVQAIEKLGSEVMLLSADVADLRAMRAVVRRAEARFGRIHGVIHAAGLGRTEPIMVKSRQSAIPVLLPKIAGTLVLERILGQRGLDFLVLFSSLSALTGGYGHVDYSSANAFLDAFAQRGSLRIDNTISINWDAWSEVGMAVNNRMPLPEKLRATREEYLKGSISTAEGLELFHRILASGLPQVAVLKHPVKDPAARDMSEQRTPPSSTAVTAKQPPSETPTPAKPEAKMASALRSTRRYPRPHLQTPFEEPRTELETIVGELWSDLLNLEKIGINDDFFELGGHSLLALQLIPRLRSRFQTEISPADIFGYPTVAAMAALIEEKLVAEIEEMEVENTT